MLVVRQAALTDLENLVPLLDGYRQFYGRASDMPAAREFLRARFALGDSVLFIAEADGQPAGFAQLYPSFSSALLARTFILNDVFVLPALRRNGIARQLVAAAAAYGESMGAARLTLSTATDNVPAQALYASLGWQKDEQFFVYHYFYTH